MRRRPGGSKHSMELLIASSALDLQARGIPRPQLVRDAADPHHRRRRHARSTQRRHHRWGSGHAGAGADPRPARDRSGTGLWVRVAAAVQGQVPATVSTRCSCSTRTPPHYPRLPARSTSAYLPDAQLRATLTLLRRAVTSSRRHRPRSSPADPAPPARSHRLHHRSRPLPLTALVPYGDRGDGPAADRPDPGPAVVAAARRLLDQAVQRDQRHLRGVRARDARSAESAGRGTRRCSPGCPGPDARQRPPCWSEVLSGFFTDHHGGILRMMLDTPTITNPCPGPGGGGFSGQTHLTDQAPSARHRRARRSRTSPSGRPTL